jgi:hypothetical protein
MVRQVGYLYENIEAETDDGYIIQMSRLPNTDSLKCVYF